MVSWSCSTRSAPPAPTTVIDIPEPDRLQFAPDTLIKRCPEELKKPSESMSEETWTELHEQEGLKGQLEFLANFIKDHYAKVYFECAERHNGLVDWIEKE